MKSQLCQREVFKRSEFPYPGITWWGLNISHLFIFPEIFAAAKLKGTDISLFNSKALLQIVLK